jgi:predicted HAD superfamily phosphohydrolase YqeG
MLTKTSNTRLIIIRHDCNCDDKLVDKGVKGIITDLDNTLVGWDVKEPTERVKAWFKDMNSA